MGKITRHPLYQKADAIRTALFLNGFDIIDDDSDRELLETDSSVQLFHEPEDIHIREIVTGDGSYALRTRLLPAKLPFLSGKFPLKAAMSGMTYDGADSIYPQHERIEGVIADNSVTLNDLTVLWNRILKSIYGIGASASLEPGGNGTLTIMVNISEDHFTFGFMGPGTWIARSVLGITGSSVSTWFFTIDVDMVAVHDFGLSDRKCLYDNTLSFIGKLTDDRPSFGDAFSSKAADVLRSMGYCQYIGERFYTSDAYVRMNMIQDAWDTNNKGIDLKEPLKGYDNPLTSEAERTGLPTVLTPALEQAMSDNFAAGEASVKLFDIGHIFKPGQGGASPWEVMALSVGSYGPDVEFRSFLGDVTRILRSLGISNSFFIPTDLAIAYRQDQCMVILDEKMKYLDGNCGLINPVALKNFRIDTDGFMAQFELPSLEAKARQEYGFVPYELR